MLSTDADATEFDSITPELKGKDDQTPTTSQLE